ncbi:MAG: chorismate mutase [Clostridia bacterium]|nr:chorismate mutase [Clostridia bacterium]
MEKIKNLRTQIDNIDLQIALLLNQRLEVAKLIGEQKKLLGIKTEQLDRENEVVNNFLSHFSAERQEEAKTVILSVISASKKVQK